MLTANVNKIKSVLLYITFIFNLLSVDFIIFVWMGLFSTLNRRDLALDF